MSKLKVHSDQAYNIIHSCNFWCINMGCRLSQNYKALATFKTLVMFAQSRQFVKSLGKSSATFAKSSATFAKSLATFAKSSATLVKSSATFPKSSATFVINKSLARFAKSFG